MSTGGAGPRGTIAAAAATLLLALAACSGPETLPANGPQRAEEVLRRALARPLPRTLQGLTRMEAFVDGQARKGQVLARIAMPDRAQLQALTPSLDLIAVFATDGQRFVTYERGADACRVGRACPQNMGRLVPIALPPGELVPLLLGRPPVLIGEDGAGGPGATLAWDADRAAYRVRIVQAPTRLRQDVWVQPGSWRILATVLYRGGERVASVAYGQLDALGPAGPPTLLRMQTARPKIDLSLELRDVTLDASIEPDAFTPPCPLGMRAVELPCAATRGR